MYNFNNPECITINYKIAQGDFESTNPILPPPYIGCERSGGLRLSSTSPRPKLGESFVLTVTEGNVSVQATVIQMELRNYMGESLGIIANFTGTKRLEVRESNYLPYLRNSRVFRFSVGTFNSSGGFVFHDALRITLEYDQVQVQARKAPTSTTITLTLTYTNPLSIPMTGVIVSVSSPNNTYLQVRQPDIPAASRFTSTIRVQCGGNDNSSYCDDTNLTRF